MNKGEKVLVGLSGGVDSAMTAFYLKQKGFEVSGVYLKLNEQTEAEELLVDKIAAKLEIKVIKVDLKSQFKELIVESFLQDYRLGVTPNPCIWCNPQIKFRFLLKEADRQQIRLVATGHYAIIEKSGKVFQLKRALDKSKDQSYFLYRLTQKELARIIFPLGGKLKEKIKAEAKVEKLFFQKKESQDVCFLAQEKTTRNFIEQKLGEKTGKILDESGAVLGEHRGGFFFTIGQRKGLGLSGGPFYVVGKKGADLIVTKDKKSPRLLTKKVSFKDCSWVSHQPEEGKTYTVKVRYLTEEKVCHLVKKTPAEWEAQLEQPAWAVAPGQSIVIYDQERVVGGGIIQ